MSNTPLTDAKLQETIDGGCLPGCDSIAHEILCSYCNPEMVMAEFARGLERQLAEAQSLNRVTADMVIEVKLQSMEFEAEIGRMKPVVEEVFLFNKSGQNAYDRVRLISAYRTYEQSALEEEK